MAIAVVADHFLFVIHDQSINPHHGALRGLVSEMTA